MFDCRRKSSFTMLLSVIGRETGVTCSINQMKKKVELLVFSRDLVFLFLQVNSRSLFFLTLAIINVKKVGNINTRIKVFVVHINFIYLEILNGINECYEKSLKWMDCADAFLHLRSNYFMKSFSYFSFKKIQTQFDRK